MKNLVLISVAVIFSLAAYAQLDGLPSKVNSEFKKKFPNATEAYWYEEGENCKLEFEISSNMHSALYSQGGLLIESSKYLEESELPQKVVLAIGKKFSDYELQSIELVTNSKSETFYKVSGYNEDFEFKLHISKEGTVIHSEKEATSYEEYDVEE